MGHDRTEILLVADQEAHAKLAAQAFPAGDPAFRLRVAPSLATARAALREQPAGLVIADWQLPDGCGLGLLDRAAGAPPRPLIILAGQPCLRDAVAAIKAGALDYLAVAETSAADLRELVDATNRQPARPVAQVPAEPPSQLAPIQAPIGFTEAQYRIIVERMPVTIYVAALDEASTTLYTNRQSELLLGYSFEEWLNDPDLWPRLLHPDDRERVLGLLRHCHATGEPFVSEHRMLARDGRIIWVRDEAVVVYDDTGQPLFLQGVLLNITKRKRAEQRSAAFLALGQQLSAARTAAAAARVIATAADAILGWDVFVLHLYAAASDTMQPVLAYDLIDGRRTEVPNTTLGLQPGPLVRRALAEGAYLLNRSDAVNQALGSRRFGDVDRPSEALMFVPIRRDAAIIGVLSIQSYTPGAYTDEDLTTLQSLADHVSSAIERIQAEAALHESEQRFRTLIHDLQVGVLLQGPNAEILLSNRAALSLLGLTEDQLAGRTSFDPSWNVIHEDGTPFPGPTHPVPRAIATRRPVRDVVMGVYRPALRDRVWLLVNAEPQLAANGQVQQVICSFHDISPRIQAEAALRELNNTLERRIEERTHALREAEARYRTLVEQLPAISYVVSLDAANRTLYISPQIESILGYRQSEWLGPPEIWMEHMHPDDRARIRAEMKRAYAEQRPLPSEYRLIARDGRVHWFRDEAIFLHDAEGQPLVAQGIMLDITERKQAEEALRESNRNLRLITENTTDVIFAYDMQHRLLYVNSAAEALTGYTLGELRERQFIPYVHPDDAARMYDLFESTFAGKSFVDVEYRMITRQGSIKWCSASGGPLVDDAGQQIGVQGRERDITERQRADEALRLSEARYRTLVERMSEGLVQTDLHERIEFANARFCELTGYSRAELIGQNASTLLIQEQDRPRMAEHNRRRMQGISDQYELQLRQKSSDLIWVQISGAPITDSNGAVVGTIGVHTDITERRRMAAALQQERARLAQRVEERTAELRAANDQLAHAARLKDEFLASMSHELRTPLNTILGMSETLQEQIYGPITDEQAGALVSIIESGQHLLALINDILDLSKIEAGQLRLELGPVTVAELCQSSLQFIKPAAHQKQLHVDLELDPAVIILEADPRRLMQMLVNLLSNAVKFTPSGGTIRLVVAGDPAARAVRFSVHDTGIGVAAEDIGRLFQPFIQLDSRLAREYTGTGLGLALVARMAALHGGDVAVESAPGQGSHFTIRLPWRVPSDSEAELLLDQPQEPPPAGQPNSRPAPATADAPAPGKQPTILLADDNSDNVTMFSRYLRVKGYHVVIARNGAEVLERAGEARPDLILMDIQMPDIDGLEATRQIRLHPDLATTPIFALTALAMPGDRERCLEAGMDEYLTKPISLQSIVDRIEEYLGPADGGQGSSHG